MADGLEQELLDLIRTRGEVSTRSLSEAFPSVHENTIRNYLRKLSDTGRVVQRRVGREIRYSATAESTKSPHVVATETFPAPFSVDDRQHRKDELAAEVDPVRRTANFMSSHVRLARARQTLSRARDLLLKKDAQELFLEFFLAMIDGSKKSNPERYRRACVRSVKAVAATLGVPHHVLTIPAKEEREIETCDVALLQNHIAERVSATPFLFTISGADLPVDDGSWKVGGSDVSQHFTLVNLPTADGVFNLRVAFHIVVHNAAVVVKIGSRHHARNNDQPWVTHFIPKLVGEAREWMMIDPATLYELDENKQKRLCLSSMDVGQYYIEASKMLKEDFAPNVHFRDGRIFPNDCFASNAFQDNTHGRFVRRAMRWMDSFLRDAATNGTTVCGVAKTTTTECFGPIVDWFIRAHVDREWPFEDPRPADTIWMTHLLADDTFDGSFRSTLSTCGVTRTFRDASDLAPNRVPEDKWQETEEKALKRLNEVEGSFGDLFKRILGHRVVLFFVGHSRQPDVRLPRYEYYAPTSTDHRARVASVLGAVKAVGLVPDEDHDFMARETLRTLIPSVVLYAHDHSKAVGERLALDVQQQVLEAFKARRESAET